MSDNLEKLQEVTTKELIGFFDGPKAVRESKDALNAARLAVSTLSAVGRIKATERAKDATQLMVLKNICKDQAQFDQYVKIAMPHLNPGLMIEAGNALPDQA